MKTSPRRLPRMQLTVGDLCRLVALLAVMFACLAPLRKLSPGLFAVTIYEVALGMPIVMAGAVQVLFRRGVLRLWLTTLFMVLPFVVVFLTALAAAIILVVASTARGHRYLGLAFCLVPVAAAVMYGLGLLIRVMGRSLLPDRCPQCASRRLFLDVRAAGDHRQGDFMVGRCVACGARFERLANDVWRTPSLHSEALSEL